MELFFNKNFPIFNHFDTILVKNQNKANFYEVFPEQAHKVIKTNKFNSFSEVFGRKPQSLEFTENNKENMKHKSKPHLFLPRISVSLHSKSKSSNKTIISKTKPDDRTKNFLNYLKFLETEDLVQRSLSKNIISNNKKSCHSMHEQHNLSSKENITKRKKNILIQDTNGTFDSLDHLESSKLDSKISYKSRQSILLFPRTSLINNLKLSKNKLNNELKETVSKISKSLFNLIKIVSNESKACKILFEMMQFSKREYMKKLFFQPGSQLKLIENLSPADLEKACFIKESQFDVNSKSQIYELKLINSNLIKDLQILNEKIENYLVERHLKEMGNLAEELKENIQQNPKKKLLNKLELNYENMPNNTIIDDILEFDQHFGGLSHVNHKKLIIGKTIDNLIKNIKQKK